MIIICDDNQVYSEFVKGVVEECTSLEVKTVTSCEELIAVLQVLESAGKYPDLLLIDIVMIPITGVECIKILKKIYGIPVPITAMSGAVTGTVLGEVREQGVMSFITKSHDAEKVKKDVKALLRVFISEQKPVFKKRVIDDRITTGCNS